MTAKKITKPKPVIRETNHRCTKAEILNRHSEILERTDYLLYGNGTPKDGLLFKMDTFIREHATIMSDISEIKLTVGKAITDSATTQKLLEKYRSDEEQFERGKNAINELEEIKKKNNRENIKLTIQVITVIIALFMAYLGAKAFYDKLTKQYDNLGTPVIVNERGISTLPKGDSLKYFRNGEFQNFDTIKK